MKKQYVHIATGYYEKVKGKQPRRHKPEIRGFAKSTSVCDRLLIIAWNGIDKGAGVCGIRRHRAKVINGTYPYQKSVECNR